MIRIQRCSHWSLCEAIKNRVIIVETQSRSDVQQSLEGLTSAADYKQSLLIYVGVWSLQCKLSKTSQFQFAYIIVLLYNYLCIFI